LIFVDEFGANLGMTRLYGYAPSGQRAYGKAPENTDPNLTLVLGLELQGLVAPVVFEGAMNRPRFETYAREYLAPVLQPGDVVLVDRIKAHLNPEVRAAIEAAGAEFHPLPPYSPDFSPVEECGSKVKQALRSAGQRTVVGVLDAMDSALHQVTPKDAEGWFRHDGYLDRPPHPRPQRRGTPRSPAPRGRTPRGRTSHRCRARDSPTSGTKVRGLYQTQQRTALEAVREADVSTCRDWFLGCNTVSPSACLPSERFVP
jgi:transposase